MAKPKKKIVFLLSSPTLNAHPQGASQRTEAPSLGPFLLVTLLPLAPSSPPHTLPVWLSPRTLHHQREKTKPACCSVFVLGALVPRRASWPPRPGIALTLHSQAACPARPCELLVFIKILLHAQSRMVCGSWMRRCGGPGARKASGLFGLVFIWHVFPE